MLLLRALFFSVFSSLAGPLMARCQRGPRTCRTQVNREPGAALAHPHARTRSMYRFSRCMLVTFLIPPTCFGDGGEGGHHSWFITRNPKYFALFFSSSSSIKKVLVTVAVGLLGGRNKIPPVEEFSTETWTSSWCLVVPLTLELLCHLFLNESSPFF